VSARAWQIGLLLLAGSGQAMAGAYVFAGEGDPDSVTHIRGYASNFAGGALPTISVCVDNSVNPALAAQAEPSVRKVVATLNRLRSIGSNNLAFNAATDIPSGAVDFESTVLHEVGHCIGLAHPNHAGESGLSGAATNGTKSGRGANTTFDQGAGTDGLHGSRDDVRGDDVNLHWYLRNINDPGQLPAVFDSTTMAVTLDFLPNGHGFAANADRDVMAALTYPNTEAVMQQGAFGREAQRHLTADDEATLRLARSGRDRLQGTADDYTWQLNYVGQLNNPSEGDCNIRVRVDDSTGFAVCAVGGAFLNNGDLRVTGARAAFNVATNWYFSPGENTEADLTSDVASATVNQAFTVRVRVREVAGISISGEPRGEVEIVDDVAAPNTGSCTITLAGTANEQGSCSFTSRSTGIRTLRAQFLGFAGWDASNDTLVLPVNAAGAAASTTTITAATPSPSVVGQPYQVSVSVTSGAGTPTGSVQVSDGAGASCSIATLSGGNGSCNLTSTSAGARTLVAMYSGGGGIGGSQGSRAQTVNPAATTSSITGSSPEPSALNQAVQVSYTVVTQAPGSGTPAGTVTVTAQNGGENCSAAVSAGSCTLTLTNAGSRNLVAAYAGNANFAASQSAPRAHRVLASSNVQIVSLVPAAAVVGQPYTVNVSIGGAAGTPTGTVNVSDDAGAACVAALQGDGTGQCVLRSRSAGNRQVTAAYGGDASYSPGTAGTAQTVAPAATSVTVLGTTPEPSQEGQAVQVSYAVSVLAPGEGPLSGNVQVIAAAGGEQCTAIAAAGSCSIVLNALGERSLSVQYLGDGNFQPSAAQTTQTVTSAQPGRIFRSGFEAGNL
jgi:hypothetical protein